jgi:hypothetical protein
MNIVTAQELSSITALPQATAVAVLALITRLHKATREFDALYRGDTERFGPAYETTSDISAVADELATLLGVSIDEAWAPVLAAEAVV